ncbi:MAG: Sec-independent protein translocase protein TatB [Cellvibrionales bacterium]|nr:Sec-independent protein translocase protein TatB [Cellvibrionales bacterium]
MFDIGFAEVLIVFVLILLVFGPERLPEVIRTVALFVGRAKRQYRNIRNEVERGVGADEIRRELYNEEIMANLKAYEKELNDPFDADMNTSNSTKANDKQPPS